MSSDIKVRKIGVIYNNRKKVSDDDWGSIVSTIKLEKKIFDPDILKGLKEFSHVEVIFYMHKVINEKIILGSSFPRGNKNLPKVGMLAQRGKNRINQIGATFCEIVSVGEFQLKVKKLDAINGTYVLDLKPCIKQFLPKNVIQPNWVDKIMNKYF